VGDRPQWGAVVIHTGGSSGCLGRWLSHPWYPLTLGALLGRQPFSRVLVIPRHHGHVSQPMVPLTPGQIRNMAAQYPKTQIPLRDLFRFLEDGCGEVMEFYWHGGEQNVGAQIELHARLTVNSN
jgi:hypothetical protein